MNEASIFADALQRPTPEGRAAFLRDACGADDALRDRVRSLLDAHDRAAGFLEEPAAAAGPTLDLGPWRAAERPGATVGPYKLLQQIGEGGMGVVYLAEQERPVRRRVALKIIRPGMDTAQVVARFEAERQALALMDHPNIAKVFDGGSTDAGRPYFVMELVKGVPITEFCDAGHLDPRERLGLLVQVCLAVQHAHTKGVIHRDIKPGNVLVTMHDDKPVPKVIDFGIAKATNQRLTERTLFTEHRQMVGTPAYMSPEQAQMNALDVDTRSDVYSLGVLLYELLTGTTPFDPKQLREAGYGEVQRIIREVEPPTPSARISTLGRTLPAVAASRKVEPRRLGPLVRGELDWIVMRALEKDRARRYESAAGLARDVERHLKDEPVEACPPGALYRFRKSLRKHRAAAAVAAVVFLSLAAGVVGTGLGLRQAARERDAAVAASAAAERERRTADATSRFLRDMVGSADRTRGGNPATVTMRQVVDQTADRLDRGALAGEPAVEAAARTTLAHVYMGDSDKPRAERQARRALDLRRQVHGPEHPEVARAMCDVVLAMGYAADRVEEAVALARGAVAMQRRLLGDAHPDVARGLCAVGAALNRSRPAEAEPAFAEAVAIFTRSADEEDLYPTFAIMGCVECLGRKGEWGRAESIVQSWVDRLRSRPGRSPAMMTMSLMVLATAQEEGSKPAAAVATYRETVALAEQNWGAADEGTANLRRSLAVARAAAGELTPDQLFAEAKGDPIVAYSQMGTALLDRGRHAAAEPFLRKASEVRDAALPAGHWKRYTVRVWLGQALLGQGRRAEAEACYNEAYAGLEPQLTSLPAGDREAVARIFDAQAELFGKRGDAAAAAVWDGRAKRARPSEWSPATRPATAPSR